MASIYERTAARRLSGKLQRCAGKMVFKAVY
jgi:hypothetical protein